ncbi:prostatic acid phosphatase-like [Tiliqua scincoides]|uniref:prostatic acid phosphatase-like n=1 Tax=Tiliqua scincoides TaxID=71010 RepID=UPI0034634D04
MTVISLAGSFHRFGFSFLSVFCVLLLQSATGRKLKFVLLVMRHGDRTPLGTFPTDQYKEDIWPQGFGQLTTLGMQQQHQTGEFLRKRYSQFLSAEYNRKEIYVRSTDVDRTIMSAQANLAGLFPPTGWQIWNEQIPWQPIPVHTVPLKDDKLLHFPLRNCVRYRKLMKETMRTPEVQDKIKSKMEEFTTLAFYSGYDVQTLLDLNNHTLWNIYDALYVQMAHRYKLPHWVTWSSYKRMRQMKEILTFGLNAMFGVHKREEKSRLQGGVLVKDILEKITNASQPASKTKMVMYSAHDTTIVALQMALQGSLTELPKYAACYLFELYQESNSEHTVEMYFRRSFLTKQPTPVILPGCSAACPLEKFKQLVSPIIPNNWEDECNN